MTDDISMKRLFSRAAHLEPTLDDSRELILAREVLRRQAQIDKLQAERDAVDALHQPEHSISGTYCCLCIELWPCETHVLLHPEEARRER